MKGIDKVKLVIFIIFRIIVTVGGVFAVFNSDWIILAQAVVTLIISFLPSIIEKKLNMDFPSGFDIIIVIFIFASMYLGEMNAFFIKFWWWDLFLHALSGLIFGAIGFSLVYVLNRNENVAINLSPVFVCVFSFCFSITIGVLWEIFEFVIDTVLGVNMQKSGLVDTMSDLIVAVFGALAFSIIGYLYLKGKTHILDKFTENFVGKNSNISA